MNSRQIELKEITFGYGKHNIFHGQSLSLKCSKTEGKVVAIVGPSGSGKTTLFRLILDLVTPSSGLVSFQPTRPIISYLPQNPVIFEHLSIKENAYYFSRISKMKRLFDEYQLLKTAETLDMVDLLQRSGDVSDLSGGEKQRLCLIRALSIKPHILLLDEPSKGIGAETKTSFILQLLSLIRKEGILTLYISHNVDEVKLVSDEVVFLSKYDDSTHSNFQHTTTKVFAKNPRNLQAAKSIHFPNTNTLSFKIINSKIDIVEKTESSRQILFLSQHHIDFDFTDGFQIEKNMGNQLFDYIWLEKGPVLILEKGKYLSQPYIVFSGTIPIYSKAGAFVGDITLDRNNVIRHNFEL